MLCALGLALILLLQNKLFQFKKKIFINGRKALQTVSYDIFDLLNTQLNFPISLTSKAWDFEVGYNLNLPKATAAESDLPTTGFFNLSVGYMFDLNKK